MKVKKYFLSLIERHKAEIGKPSSPLVKTTSNVRDIIFKAGVVCDLFFVFLFLAKLSFHAFLFDLKTVLSITKDAYFPGDYDL